MHHSIANFLGFPKKKFINFDKNTMGYSKVAEYSNVIIYLKFQIYEGGPKISKSNKENTTNLGRFFVIFQHSVLQQRFAIASIPCL